MDDGQYSIYQIHWRAFASENLVSSLQQIVHFEGRFDENYHETIVLLYVIMLNSGVRSFSISGNDVDILWNSVRRHVQNPQCMHNIGWSDQKKVSKHLTMKFEHCIAATARINSECHSFFASLGPGYADCKKMVHSHCCQFRRKVLVEPLSFYLTLTRFLLKKWIYVCQ